MEREELQVADAKEKFKTCHSLVYNLAPSPKPSY